MDRGPVATVAAGTVRVSIQVSRSPEVAWLALSDPGRLAMWFGQLDQPWFVGRGGRIDFGDGDFFVVTALEVVDGRFVEFEWSFLGVGPVERIRWSVHALPSGAEVVVEDHDPDRTPPEVNQMIAGWSDFLGRLRRYLATGRETRYEWREDIDGSAELTDTGFQPLHDDVIYRWLPIATDGFEPRWVFIVDEQGPRRFRVVDFQKRPASATFSVEIPGAVHVTHCKISVERVGSRRRLLFSHTGWRTLGLPDNRSRVLRSRFAASWTASLKQARELALAGAPRDEA